MTETHSSVPSGQSTAGGYDRPDGGRAPYDQAWLTSLLRPLLIAILVACLDIALLSLISRFAPALGGGNGQVLVLFSVIVVFVGCATTTWLAQPGQRQRRAPIYRLTELAFIIVITRLLLWGLSGQWPTLAMLLYRPLATLLDGLLLSAGLVVIISWFLATDLTSDLLRLALQPDELFALENDRIGEIIRTSNSDRPAVLRRLVGRWVAGGIVLVLVASGLQIERPVNGFFALSKQNIDPSVIAAIVIYFLVGLVLISQGQLALLRTRWLIDRVPATESVLRQWPLYVVLLLVVIGLLATLLPFGGTFLLAQILYTVVTSIFNAIFGVFRFLMGLLLLLIAAIMGKPQEAPPPEAPPPPPQPMFQELPPAASQLPAWTGGAIFWVVMALFLGYAAYIYLNDKGVRFTWLVSLWQMLRERWRLLFGAYTQWQRSHLPTLGAKRGAVEGEPEQQRGGLPRNWRQLDPTQQARYFYLTTLVQAKASGLPRAEGETPSQYALRLAAFIAQGKAKREGGVEAAQPATVQAANAEVDEPEVERAEADHEAVQKLTAAFLQARYTKRPIAVTESQVLVKIWENLKVYLRL